MTGTIKKSAVCWSLAVLMLLTACGGGASTLEGMVENSPEAKEAVKAQCKDGQTVEVNGNGLIYTYKFEQTFKGKDIKTVQKDIAKKMEKSRLKFQKTAAALQESSGLEKVTVKLVYINGDGKEIYSEEI